MNIRDWVGSVDSRILIEEFDSFWNEVFASSFVPERRNEFVALAHPSATSVMV